MKYALTNNTKVEATESGQRGVCICCGSEMIAHCGLQKINHWKHKSLTECDSWHESETEWHRSWKNHFPAKYQEVVMHDKVSGEKHIADIFIKEKGLTIEIQHSPIHIEEIKSRELFYKKMLWIIDAIPYKENISLHKNIESAFFDHIIMPWATESDRINNRLIKEGKEKEAKEHRSDRSGDDYINYFEKKYYSYSDKQDYFLMQWKYQHKRWNTANAPLFFDLGDEYLYMSIESIKIWNGFMVKRFLRSTFIEKYNQ